MFSLIYIDLIDIHSTEIAYNLNFRLYGYRTLSQKSFDTNNSPLGLPVAKINVIFYVYRLTNFGNFPVKSKGFVNIHRTKKMNYML